MNLIVDASAILRQILSRRVPRLLVHPRLDLFITHHVAEEVERNLDRRVQAMLAQGRLVEEEATALVAGAKEVMVSALTLAPATLYAIKEPEARSRLEQHCRDRDWPSVALALLMGMESDGIWTEDRDYWGCGVATWSTAVLQRVLVVAELQADRDEGSEG